MMPKPETSSPHSGRKRWWMEILQTSWAKEKRTTDATSPWQQTATGQPCELGKQPRKFKVQEWLRWRWKNTGTQLRSKMRWGSLSYIANTWDEELTSSGCSASSSSSDPKLDRDGRPVRECPVDDGGNNKGVAEEGIVLDRERLVQALFVGATVAATLYVVYRIGLRYRWWRWRDLEERDASGVDSVKTMDDRKGDDRAPEDSGVEDAPNSSSIGVDERREDNESVTDAGDTASTVAPELSPGRGNSLSDAESLLAEAEDLISSESSKPLPPQSVAEMPSEYREVSGEEVDALVKLTRRAIARDPDALNEIARQAAAHGVVGASDGAGSSVEGSPVVWRRGHRYVERNGGGLVSGGKGVVGASSSESRRPVHFFA